MVAKGGLEVTMTLAVKLDTYRCWCCTKSCIFSQASFLLTSVLIKRNWKISLQKKMHCFWFRQIKKFQLLALSSFFCNGALNYFFSSTDRFSWFFLLPLILVSNFLWLLLVSWSVLICALCKTLWCRAIVGLVCYRFHYYKMELHLP